MSYIQNWADVVDYSLTCMIPSTTKFALYNEGPPSLPPLSPSGNCYINSSYLLAISIYLQKATLVLSALWYLLCSYQLSPFSGENISHWSTVDQRVHTFISKWLFFLKPVWLLISSGSITISFSNLKLLLCLFTLFVSFRCECLAASLCCLLTLKFARKLLDCL